MPLITSSDEYSIGVPDIDPEHLQLIELINRLYKDLYAETTDFEKEALGGHLKKWIATHFKTKDVRLHKKLS